MFQKRTVHIDCPKFADTTTTLYILGCADDSIYVGISKDSTVRYKQHLHGRGAVFTSRHRPETMLACRFFENRYQALYAERVFQGLLDGARASDFHGVDLLRLLNGFDFERLPEIEAYVRQWPRSERPAKVIDALEQYSPPVEPKRPSQTWKLEKECEALREHLRKTKKQTGVFFRDR